MPDTQPFTAADYRFMAQALELARRGLYTTTPNPRVGCVIVRDGQVIGEGYHARAGEAHAEVHALRQAGEQARGSTVYVTLEPCAHYGRTPPCAEALLQAGVARVVAAMADPNPLVAGRGLALLERNGIMTGSGLLAAEAAELNRGFVARMTRGRPWLRLKIAASLDGRTALANGVSQWITDTPARSDVHRWRAQSCAVLTGIGTVLADDPELSVRHVETSRQPARIVVDSQLRLPPTARLLAAGKVLVATTSRDTEKIRRLEQAGAELLQAGSPGGQVDLNTLLVALAARGCNEILTEAGATLSGALLQAGLVDELIIYLAPRLMGGAARGMLDLPGYTQMAQVPGLAIQEVRAIGQDWRVMARVNTLGSEE
jgi:diaminohydroxyphosphoribosylaminopyrimidine deaminase / 5-amino-6-(5-phosphoribosylamino)uracil reductase